MSSPDIVRHVSRTFMLSSTTLLGSSVASKLICIQSLWQARSLFASSKRKGMLRAWLKGACWPILCHINGIAGRWSADHVVSHLHFLDWKTTQQISCRGHFGTQLVSTSVGGGTSFQVLCIPPDASPLTPPSMLLVEVSALSPHSAVLYFLTGSLAGHNYPAVLDLFHPQFLLCSESLLYLYNNEASTVYDCYHSADSREYLITFGNLWNHWVGNPFLSTEHCSQGPSWNFSISPCSRPSQI